LESEPCVLDPLWIYLQSKAALAGPAMYGSLPYDRTSKIFTTWGGGRGEGG